MKRLTTHLAVYAAVMTGLMLYLASMLAMAKPPRCSCCGTPFPRGHSHRNCEKCDLWDDWISTQNINMDDDDDE